MKKPHFGAQMDNEEMILATREALGLISVYSGESYGAVIHRLAQAEAQRIRKNREDIQNARNTTHLPYMRECLSADGGIFQPERNIHEVPDGVQELPQQRAEEISG